MSESKPPCSHRPRRLRLLIAFAVCCFGFEMARQLAVLYVATAGGTIAGVVEMFGDWWLICPACLFLAFLGLSYALAPKRD